MSAPPSPRTPRRGFLKPSYIPAVSSSELSDGSDTTDEKDGGKGLPPPSNPLDPLRRGSVMMEFLGAGALSLGSTLVISLYVCGVPRIKDLTTASTATLFMSLLLGCAAGVPSWLAVLLILLTAKGDPPPHGKLLRLAALGSFFLATIYSCDTLVLYVLLNGEDSFIDFCLLNIPSTTAEDCTERWNRSWVMILVVGIVWIMHLALGFPVYRYTRGTQYGEQLESGSFLLELPPHPSSPSSTRRRSLHRRLSLMDSSSESDDGPLERPIVEQAVGKTRRTRRSSKKRSVRPVSSRRRRRGRVEQVDEGGSSQEELVEAGEQEGEGEEQEKEREECRQQRRRTRQ